MNTDFAVNTDEPSLAATRTHPELKERAARLTDLLRENAARADAQRRVPEANIAALADAGFFRLQVPRRFGGLEAAFLTQVNVAAELGAACGSTAWVLSLINSTSWIISHFPERAQREVYGAHPDARACSVLMPTARTETTPGGRVVNGTWRFASGCLHAQWAVLGFPILDEAGQTIDQGLALIPMRDLRIEDTWHVAGMRGTGSNTLVAEKIFVPDHRIITVANAIAGKYPTENRGEVLYRVPFVPGLALILAGPQLGMARGALRLVATMLSKNKEVSQTYYHDARLAPSIQIQFAEATQLIETAQLHMERAATDVERWAASGMDMPISERARVRMDVGYISRRAREAVDILLNIHGASSFAESNPMQRIWRDLETASRHAMANSTVASEVYGRALLSVEDQITLLI